MAKLDIFKKINRNAFNEKLIHRYLFERYYLGILSDEEAKRAHEVGMNMDNWI
ncbi:MAG: hypothetical protein P9X22_06760 [Candidatus Zapsychrus exili]|nr:hypothetical protein [Candidatus Zapsychrus exili]